MIVVSAIALAVGSSGCFVYNPAAEFVKQRYTNTVSYFNTFYNAQRAFDDAEQEMLVAQRDFRERSLAGGQFTLPQSARSKFTVSIEKNSKVLSFYADSKWVDDALLMIGKAYFYLEDDVRAERKFLELEVKFPESDLLNEAILFLGRSLMRQKKYAEGTKRLDDLYTKALVTDKNIAGMASVELARYYFSQEDYIQAEKFFSQALPLLDDEELQAIVQFSLAQCFEKLKNYRKAEEEYRKVADYEAGYTLQFTAVLSRARMLVQMKEFEKALEMLEQLLDDTKNKEFYASIHFHIAETMQAQGDRSTAMEKYRYIDTAFARTDEAAKSYFALAKIYETQEINYDSARVLYGKARTEFPTSKITEEAARKAEIFIKYDTFIKDLARFDSLIANAKRQKEIDDSLRAFTIDSAAIAVKDTLAVSAAEQKNRKATRPSKKSETTLDSLSRIDSAKIKAAIAKELAHKQLLDSLHRSLTRTKFELGGLFFLELQIPDSAVYWYSKVIQDDPNSDYAPRALYTIAEIYRTAKEQSQAVRDSLYAHIIKVYPNSPYAHESRKILGLPPVVVEKDSAEELFNKAESLAEEGNYQAAINTYKVIPRKFSTSPLTPKALYAVGWHFENSLVNTDSAFAAYKRLIAEFPSSVYAAAVRPKVIEYENEQKRIEAEKQKKIEEEEQKLEEQKQKEQQEKEAVKTQPPPTPVTQDSLHTPH